MYIIRQVFQSTKRNIKVKRQIKNIHWTTLKLLEIK